MMDILEQILFTDPQDQVPVCYCTLCGGARFAPSLVCIRCERRGL